MQEESQPVRFSIQAKLITVGLIVGLAILLIYLVQHILAPFIAAIITAYLFNPLISILQRQTNIGRGIWITILYILAFSLIYSVGTLVWPRITAQYQELASWIPTLITDITKELEGNRTIDLGTGLTIDLAPLGEQVGDLI
ncbi:MAG: AI-2E family transporter, partial [Chloroflexales bacterium]|nr:AI-2E family transporter [Chloroflexales bacterium]